MGYPSWTTLPTLVLAAPTHSPPIARDYQPSIWDQLSWQLTNRRDPQPLQDHQDRPPRLQLPGCFQYLQTIAFLSNFFNSTYLAVLLKYLKTLYLKTLYLKTFYLQTLSRRHSQFMNTVNRHLWCGFFQVFYLFILCLFHHTHYCVFGGFRTCSQCIIFI